jgi:predicted nucleic acid-binding protein
MYDPGVVTITVDTSVVIAVATEESSKRALVKATAGAVLVAPASVHWEVGNALSAMLKKRRIRLAQAEAAVAAYRQIPIRFIDVDLLEALRISDATGLYAYDSYVLACAEALGTPLLSLDAEMTGVAKDMELEVMEVES